jgi:hypothetical protein
MNCELFKGTEQGGSCCGGALCAITSTTGFVVNKPLAQSQPEWVWGPLVFSIE